jgi:hypothetical protein
LNAREVFFLEDKIILVEGQDDVVSYRDISAQLEVRLNGEFFGWGVGGADNMRAIARILLDLGFEVVVGIVDANKAHVAEALRGEFPNYRFFTIPADDVRTKEAKTARDALGGLLDKDGKLDERYASDIREMFRDINQVLSKQK